MIQMVGDKIRIRSEGSPFEVANDIFVEMLVGNQWVVQHAYNSIHDVKAMAHASELAMQLLSKM